MAQDTLESVEKLLASGDTSGALDCLIQSFAARGDYPSLFEARRMKCRLELGLPLIQIQDAAASAAESSPEYQKALIQAARDVGELALQEGNIPAAWRFFRAIGDHEPVAAAIERVQPGDNVEEIIAIALQEGVHPVKGLDLVLSQHGMCRAITVFGMIPSSKGRAESIALLVRTLHREVAESLARTIEAQEGIRPDSASLHPLIRDRDWLFGEYDYYVDTSHLLSLLPYSIEVTDEQTLRLVHELCEYGKRLSSMFQFKGQPPFERPFVDYGEYVGALLGDDNRINHFRRKLEDANPEDYGTAAAEVLVGLLARRELYEEALDVCLAHLQDEDPASLSCPSAVQLAALSGRYDRLRSNARQRGDVLGYVAATVMGGRT
jgi:hypothetical protein